ncbi:ubiquitin-like protein Pup [soil metagenome]|jgi:ubiquitin-like protein Pup
MSDGGQVRKQKGKQTEEQDTPVENETPEVDTSDVDDLLDEIDEVLEENAEEFVKNYVQKGGQ